MLSLELLREDELIDEDSNSISAFSFGFLNVDLYLPVEVLEVIIEFIDLKVNKCYNLLSLSMLLLSSKMATR